MTVLLWVARAALALVFLGAGGSKLAGEGAMVDMFADIGAGQWLRLVVGGLEVAGAVGVLVPRVALPAAAGLALLMVGATLTNLLVLGESPVVTLVLGVLAAAVAVVLRRRQTAPA
ncbi:DoxX family protein [Cellulomonas fimi]|uniref:DoxX family protein n=1 Tax=Cellulomonas fimi TaxID=1708 RepID=UPI002358F350|nr:DoxX family protein [Cellulomonas fimi]